MDVFANTVPGFLCAYSFDEAGGSTSIEERDVPQLIAGGEGWFWLHLNLTDQRCGKWLAEHIPVNGMSWTGFVETDVRPGLKAEGEAICGKLLALRRGHAEGFAEQALLSLVLAGRFLVTGRTRPLHEPDALRKHLALGKLYANAGALLAALVGQHIEELEDMAGDLLARLEHIEDDVFADGRNAERQQLMTARRDGAYAHRLVRTTRRTLLQAARQIECWPDAMEINLNRLGNLDQDLEILEQRARFLHDELDAKLAAETNRQLYVLSIVTAVFLPPSLVAGLFGMNLQGIPAADMSFGFWAAVLAAIGSASLVGLVIRHLTRG